MPKVPPRYESRPRPFPGCREAYGIYDLRRKRFSQQDEFTSREDVEGFCRKLNRRPPPILKAGEAGLWKTHGPVLIHRLGCSMLRTAGARAVKISTQDEIDDMAERGFVVRHCKCTKT
jgi:hypothetical protein